jgi:integrase
MYCTISCHAWVQEIMGKPQLKLVTPATKKRAVAPRRQPNSELRSREHLTEAEVEKLLKAAQDNRHGHRNATMILVAYRHALRAAEIVDLRWEQIDWKSATLHVRRVAQHAPHSWRRAAGAAQARAGGAKVALYFRERTRRAVHNG